MKQLTFDEYLDKKYRLYQINYYNANHTYKGLLTQYEYRQTAEFLTQWKTYRLRFENLKK